MLCKSLLAFPLSLSQAMCELVKSTSPVSTLGSQLEQLSDEHRVLLKEILRLFSLVSYTISTVLFVQAIVEDRIVFCPEKAWR